MSVIHLRDRGVGAVVLDIEGTTTPITFVHDVLFPYARAHLGEYLTAARGADVLREVTRRLAAEHAADVARGETPPVWRVGAVDETPASLAAYVEWLMDRDRKSPGLKLLQGEIWERGYRAGELRGQVFADVPQAIRRWRDAGVIVAIYSSGSELAQRRLFESTAEGSLAPFISAYFDTAVGPKTAAASYGRIADALGLDPGAVLFISDAASELDAARTAGLQALLSVRPGNAPQPAASRFECIRTFDDVVR